MLTVGKSFFNLIGDGEINDAFEISNLTDLTKTSETQDLYVSV